jgi:hypothetical protein
VALTRASSAPVGLAKRARIVLLVADGVSNAEIASRVGGLNHPGFHAPSGFCEPAGRSATCWE